MSSGEPASDPVRVLVLGSCRLNGPMSELCESGGFVTQYRETWPLPGTYSLQEVLQVLRHVDGSRPVPPAWRALCALPPDDPPDCIRQDIADSDVVLVEPVTVVGLAAGPAWLNQVNVGQQLVRAFHPAGPVAETEANAWFTYGLLMASRQASLDARRRLRRALSGDPAFAEALQTAEAIRPVRMTRHEVRAALLELRRRFGERLALVNMLHPPDEPRAWIRGLTRDLPRLAEEAGVALFDPRPLTEGLSARGVMRDQAHYTRAFMRRLLPPLAAFLRETAERGKQGGGQAANHPVEAAYWSSVEP